MKCFAVQTFDAKTKCYVSVPTYYMAHHSMKFVPVQVNFLIKN